MLAKDNNKYQNSKFRLLRLRLRRILAMTPMIGICFVFCALLFRFVNSAYALDLDGLKSSFISGDYKAAISEGEKILAGTNNTSFGLDELYYFLGLSYMKTGNYLRASDIFEIIGNEFKKSPLSEEAVLALGDTFYLRGDYDNAEKRYRKLLNNNQVIRLKPAVYYRLSRCAAKLGNPEIEKDYLLKLKQEFPLNCESGLEDDKRAVASINLNRDYTVQVGYFSNNANADNLLNELIKKGYPAYIEKNDASGKQVYRVKVGKLATRQEAEKIAAKLSKDGYPTKICP